MPVMGYEFTDIRHTYKLTLENRQLVFLRDADYSQFGLKQAILENKDIIIVTDNCADNHIARTYGNYVGYKPIGYERKYSSVPSVEQIENYILKQLIDSIFLKNEFYSSQCPCKNDFYYIRHGIAELPKKLFENYPRSISGESKLSEIIIKAYGEYVTMFVEKNKKDKTNDWIKAIRVSFNEELEAIKNLINIIYADIEKYQSKKISETDTKELLFEIAKKTGIKRRKK